MKECIAKDKNSVLLVNVDVVNQQIQSLALKTRGHRIAITSTQSVLQALGYVDVILVPCLQLVAIKILKYAI